jgi:hypothetical protein
LKQGCVIRLMSCAGKRLSWDFLLPPQKFGVLGLLLQENYVNDTTESHICARADRSVYNMHNMRWSSEWPQLCACLSNKKNNNQKLPPVDNSPKCKHAIYVTIGISNLDEVGYSCKPRWRDQLWQFSVGTLPWYCFWQGLKTHVSYYMKPQRLHLLSYSISDYTVRNISQTFGGVINCQKCRLWTKFCSSTVTPSHYEGVYVSMVLNMSKFPLSFSL